jgi:AraC-like DNA-binding protein
LFLKGLIPILNVVYKNLGILDAQNTSVAGANQVKKRQFQMTNNQLYPPSPMLASYVLSYLIIEGIPMPSKASQKAPCVSIYPNGLNALGFSFGDPSAHQRLQGSISNLSIGSFVVGTQEDTYKMLPNKNLKQFVIVFQPGILAQFLKISMVELRNEVTNIGHSVRDEQEVCERLSLCQNHRQQIDLMEHWLEKKVGSIQMYTDLTHHFIRDIVSACGDIKVNDLCQQYKINKKYIERKFDESLGISPKKYADIIRFNALLHILGTHQSNPWPEISAAAGFADYSHLSKHISKLTGLQPRDLRKKLQYMEEHKFIVDTGDLFHTFMFLQENA